MDFLQHTGLPLSAYFRALSLRAPFLRPEEKTVLLEEVLLALQDDEAMQKAAWALPEDMDEKALYRALIRQYRRRDYDEPLMALVDAWLWQENRAALVEGKKLPAVARAYPGGHLARKANIALWQGDIENLAVGAIIKPCCENLLGCADPAHDCLDNAIHFAAGPQLREDCHTLLRMQGFPEMPGNAKITRGYNLPAMYVLHIVLPEEGAADAKALAALYSACFDLATRLPHIHTIATPLLGTEYTTISLQTCAKICLDAVDGWMHARQGNFEKAIIAARNPAEFDALLLAL